MAGLVSDRILKSEVAPLSNRETKRLKAKRNRQFRFIIATYIPLLLVLAYVLVRGPEGAIRRRPITEEDRSNFKFITPWFFGSLFLLLNGYFIWYYYKTVAPLVRDIKGNSKLLLSIKPEKTNMSFFNKYYITTPIFKKQQLSIPRKDFDMVSENHSLIFHLAPNSLELLKITNNENEIFCGDTEIVFL